MSEPGPKSVLSDPPNRAFPTRCLLQPCRASGWLQGDLQRAGLGLHCVLLGSGLDGTGWGPGGRLALTEMFVRK